MSLYAIQMIKLAVAVAAVLLVFVFWCVDRGYLKPYKALLLVLAALMLFSIPCYFDFGFYPKHGRFMNPHGWFHYYLGAKYSPEVGYYNLYRAVVVADRDNTGRVAQQRMRAQETYGNETAQSVIRKADTYRKRFTPERWEEFKKDVAYFRSIFIPRRWPGVVTDKGYNATPTWNFVGYVFSNMAPTDSRPAMLFLLSLDLLLVSAMLAMVWHAFGPRAMFFTGIYFCTHFAFFTYNVNEIRGAFLRLDWVTFSVISMCLLKENHYKPAGALMAYAGLARLFPLALVFGLGCRFIWDLVQTRRINRKYLEFFTVFALVGAAMVLISIWHGGGLDAWKTFFEKIGMHDSGLSSQRTGFKYILINMLAGPGVPRSEVIEQYGLLWRACQAGILLAVFLCCAKIEDYESIALSYAALFFLTAPTTYYHIGLLIPLFLFLPKMQYLHRAIGVAGFFLITALFIIFNNTTFEGGQWAHSYAMARALLVLMGYMLCVAAWTWFSRKEAHTAPAD